MDKNELHIGYIIEPYASFVVNEISALRQQGARITVFNSFRTFEQQEPSAEALRLESHYFPPHYQGVVGDNLMQCVSTPLAYLQAASFIPRHKLSKRLLVLSAHYARLVRTLKIDHLHATFGTTPATIAMLTSWLSGVPYSFTCHAYDIFMPNPLLEVKLKHARFMTTISKFNKQFIAQHYNETDEKKIQVVYLGVDLKQWQVRGERNEKKQTPNIVCVARLDTFKGHIYLIRACQLLKQRGFSFKCVIIGDGCLHARIEAEINRLRLKDVVEMKGALLARDVQAYLEAADVFVLPSIVDEDHKRDGIPVALMEAMAMGLPVISTTVSGIPELIEDRKTGLLVPEKDEKALAEAIETIVKDEELRQTMCREARAHIEQAFDLQRSAAEMESLFRESKKRPA
jgi:colanic acid/amylovoran biosynthesis glycosyltransferase